MSTNNRALWLLFGSSKMLLINGGRKKSVDLDGMSAEVIEAEIRLVGGSFSNGIVRD